MTIAIPTPQSNDSPTLPPSATHPLPLAVTQALSNAFGITYMANSGLLLGASKSNESPHKAQTMYICVPVILRGNG
jgi:hypothetical protein